MTTPSNEQMSRPETSLRAGVALTLGIVPFACSALAMQVFKGMAYLGANTTHGNTRTLCGMIGVPSGILMIGSAKIFGLTQQLAWGKYAKNPVEDGANQRLAWYGLTHLPGKDLYALTKAFFSPMELHPGEFSLEQWSQLKI